MIPRKCFYKNQNSYQLQYTDFQLFIPVIYSQSKINSFNNLELYIVKKTINKYCNYFFVIFAR